MPNLFLSSPPIIARLIVAALLLFCIVMPLSATPTDAPGSSKCVLGGFETRVLSNGLRVWYRHIADDPNISVSVTIPYGSDQDPPGKEQLAHFVEHMLFTDHQGRTESEIKGEIEDLGGQRNGTTHWDHTHYYVTIDKQHGLFALDWLYRLISPHEMDPDVVSRQRHPIAVELKAKKRDIVDWIYASYLDSPFLRMGDFYEREFGMQTRRSRDYYPYRSLYNITPDDLRWFYNTYYNPAAMILTVAGDFPADSLWTQIEASFGTLIASDIADQDYEIHNPGRSRAYYDWAPRSTVRIFQAYKIYGCDTAEHQTLLFIRDWLSNRLRERLRYGDRKATYGTHAVVRQRGPALWFSGHIYSGGRSHLGCSILFLQSSPLSGVSKSVRVLPDPYQRRDDPVCRRRSDRGQLI